MQLAAWEVRYALLQIQPAAVQELPPPGRRPASTESVLALLVHWQEALEAVEFLNPAYPKKLMPRMRHLFSRNNLTQDEVDMMRGVCTAMIQTARFGPHQPQG